MRNLFTVALLLAVITTVAQTQAQTVPATRPASAVRVVDEPVGARYSLGLTLWHLGHDPEAIKAFDAFLAAKGVKPESLLPSKELTPPADARQILIDPELLPAAARGGWVVEGEYLTSNPLDAGPTVTMPLHVDRAGLYRVWTRSYGSKAGTAVTSLELRKAGDAAAPLVHDEINDIAAAADGPAWKSILVDLDRGDYDLSLGHVTRWWHAQGAAANGYMPRKIDCIYLTDEIGDEAPDAAVAALREQPAGGPRGILRKASSPLDPARKALWKKWRVRPIAWEQAEAHPELFALSREFWRSRIDEIAAKDYAEDKLPDYRRPERQVIFDDTWNMVGNPVRIKRQVEALRGDIDPSPRDTVWYWLYPGEFEKVTGQWQRQGTTLHSEWGASEGAAEQDLAVDRDATYHVWVRFRQINYQETWKLDVKGPRGQSASFVRDQMKYEDDITPQSAWQKVGAVELKAGEKMNLAFTLQPVKQPATYRYVHDVFVTTDAGYKPRGTVRPPLSVQQYGQRAERAGAKPGDGYFARVRPGIMSITQEWWPRAAEREDKADTPPTRAAPGSSALTITHPAVPLAMARDTASSVQVYLRSLDEKPTRLDVRAGALRGPDGKTYDGRVDWRVVGFVPLGPTRQQWSPAVLLRRPDATIPPMSVAQLWLTVSSAGLPAGEFTGEVTLAAAGLPDQVVPLKVHVAAFAAAPARGVLVGGYSQPPDGEEYLEAYRDHGMNVWYSPMSKADMKRWGIKLLLLLQQSSTDPADYRKLFARLKEMGVGYEDYALPVRDEPSGTDAESLKDYIATAKAIRDADPKARISFNPGEAGKLATFQQLDPLCDFWLPYALHVSYVVDLKEKIAIYSKKPWMWYTTPCFGDKGPDIASGLFGQIRQTPALPGDCRGTAFFAFYYPFRDPWDTAYEHIGDVSVMVLPSPHGPVSMPAFEGIREGVQAANLATMVKERAGSAAADEATKKLIAEGTVADLIAWLEAHPGTP